MLTASTNTQKMLGSYNYSIMRLKEGLDYNNVPLKMKECTNNSAKAFQIEGTVGPT